MQEASEQQGEISEEKQLKKFPRRCDEEHQDLKEQFSGICLDPLKGLRSCPLSGRAKHSKAKSPCYPQEQVKFIVHLPAKLSKLQGQEKQLFLSYLIIWAQLRVYNGCSILKEMIACFVF